MQNIILFIFHQISGGLDERNIKVEKQEDAHDQLKIAVCIFAQHSCRHQNNVVV